MEIPWKSSPKSPIEIPKKKNEKTGSEWALAPQDLPLSSPLAERGGQQGMGVLEQWENHGKTNWKIMGKHHDAWIHGVWVEKSTVTGELSSTPWSRLPKGSMQWIKTIWKSHKGDPRVFMIHREFSWDFCPDGGCQKWGDPQHGWFTLRNPTKMDDDWGYPHDFGNLHIDVHLLAGQGMKESMYRGWKQIQGQGWISMIYRRYPLQSGWNSEMPMFRWLRTPNFSWSNGQSCMIWWLPSGEPYFFHTNTTSKLVCGSIYHPRINPKSRAKLKLRLKLSSPMSSWEKIWKIVTICYHVSSGHSVS